MLHVELKRSFYSITHTHSNFMILEVTKLFRNTQTKRTNQICMGECGCGKNLGRKKKKKIYAIFYSMSELWVKTSMLPQVWWWWHNRLGLWFEYKICLNYMFLCCSFFFWSKTEEPLWVYMLIFKGRCKQFIVEVESIVSATRNLVFKNKRYWPTRNFLSFN